MISCHSIGWQVKSYCLDFCASNRIFFPIIQLPLLVSKVPPSYFHYDFIRTSLTPSSQQFSSPLHSSPSALTSTLIPQLLVIVSHHTCQLPVTSKIYYCFSHDQRKVDMCVYVGVFMHKHTPDQFISLIFETSALPRHILCLPELCSPATYNTFFSVSLSND